MTDSHETARLSFIPSLFPLDALESPLPLERTVVQVQITGLIASVMVTQKFANPLLEAADLEYLCPLPENAALFGFEMRIGEQVIRGELREREAARQEFAAASSAGKQASLFEQRRPNLFAIRLANVPAGEALDVTLRYQQRLTVQDKDWAGEAEFVFPMGLTPKYDRAGHPEEQEGVHAPVARPEETIGPVEIVVLVDAGTPVDEPVSPSHSIETARVNAHSFLTHLAGTHIPDHDFVLRYAFSAPEPEMAIWTARAQDQAFFFAVINPPRLEEAPEPAPRELIFVVDRSGSMSGEPIRQARNALRACLRTLNPADTFRILLFDNELEWFLPEPAEQSQENIDQADRFLAAVQGRGGTEIGLALRTALQLPPDPARKRFVVFLTDGAVSAEAAVLTDLRKWIGAASLFTFGIGPSVNRALLKRMAEWGHGRASFLQLEEDIEGAIMRFQDSISYPILTDLSLDWEGGPAWEVYPPHLPDLYSGQPLEISARLDHLTEALTITLRGKRAGQPVEMRQTVSISSNAEAIETSMAARAWAQARIEELLAQQHLEPAQAEAIRAEIVRLALAHRLVTPYTSFTAVDESSEGARASCTVQVSQPLPQGLAAGGFGLAAPQVGYPPAAAPALLTRASMAAPVSTAMARNRLDEASSGFQRVSRGVQSLLQKSRRVQDDLMAKVPMDETIAAHGPEEALDSSREETLRWLARTQQVDGSWRGDALWTALALLAFVRAGQTPRSGMYRSVMNRAVKWLIGRAVQPDRTSVSAFWVQRALQELADATGDATDRQAAQTARQALPQPQSVLERALMGERTALPEKIQTEEELSLAALQKGPIPSASALAALNISPERLRLWLAISE